MFKFVWSFLKNNLLQFIFMIIVILALWAASLGVPKITGEYIDSILNRNLDISYTKILIIAFVIIALVEFITTFYSAYLGNKLSNWLRYKIMIYLLSYIRKLPLSFFKKMDSSYLTQRINQDSWEVASFSTLMLSKSVINIFTLIAIYIYIFSVDISIGIKLFLLIPIYFFIYKLFEKPIYKFMLDQSEKTNKVSSSLNNQLLNIKVIKANSWFDLFDKEIKEKIDLSFKAMLKFNRVQFIFYSLDILVNRAATIILIVYAGTLVLDGRMTVGQFTIINSYFVIAMQSMTSLLDLGSSYQQAKVSYDRINEILNIKVENNGQKILSSIDSIEIKNLTFKYDDGRKIFENFNYKFEKGKVYCILGQNGRGKSTLTNVILGLYLDYEGEILYNGENLKDLDLYSIRNHIVGYVEQDPMIIQDTLKTNLCMNTNDLNEENLNYWCGNLDIDALAEKMGNGYNTLLSENGSNLSGGEKQRIVLCRTLQKNPSLIIMDEPTSALDKASKERLQVIINEIKEDKIIIIITHDNEFKEISDEIVAL